MDRLSIKLPTSGNSGAYIYSILPYFPPLSRVTNIDSFLLSVRKHYKERRRSSVRWRHE